MCFYFDVCYHVTLPPFLNIKETKAQICGMCLEVAGLSAREEETYFSLLTADMTR
jgi:hypothetical protein